MNAYPSLRALFSSLLLALPACGTSILGGGGGAGTGGASTCTESGDHTIPTAGLSLACTQDSDCTAVYTGDACATCFCADAAIAVSSLAAYQQEKSAKSQGCCPPDLGCGIACQDPVVSCQQGTCHFGTGPACSDSGDHAISTAGLSVACAKDADCTTVYTGTACSACACGSTPLAVSSLAAYQQQASYKSQGCCTMPGACPCPFDGAACLGGSCVNAPPGSACDGALNPQSCTTTACPSGWTCTPDPDPTTCHPSSCSCTATGWACSADCGTHGSSCVKGA